MPFSAARAQDTLAPDRGVRIGITYSPGLRPGILVLGGSGDVQLDSIRIIIQRDLDYSDRFELISLPGGDSLTIGLEAVRPDLARATAPATSVSGSFVNY